LELPQDSRGPQASLERRLPTDVPMIAALTSAITAVAAS
jgi:hypothetical protein